jgi:hypothetical protein
MQMIIYVKLFFGNALAGGSVTVTFAVDKEEE